MLFTISVADWNFLGILVVAHPYITHDPYLSGAVVDALSDLGATVVYADAVDHDKAYKKPRT